MWLEGLVAEQYLLRPRDKLPLHPKVVKAGNPQEEEISGPGTTARFIALIAKLYSFKAREPSKRVREGWWLQAAFDAHFNSNTFSTLLRPREDVQENEQRRQSAIEEQNALMRHLSGGVPEPIVQHIPEEPLPVEEPKTPVDLLREDCEMLRAGVERMTAQLASSAQTVRFDFKFFLFEVCNLNHQHAWLHRTSRLRAVSYTHLTLPTKA